MNRQQRRATAARLRTTIQKRTPFGRVVVLALDAGESPEDYRVVYLHTTKGIVDRRITDPLFANLMKVA